ncbi:DUF2971 domain-containing protein [Leptospira wolffii]|uniref:DUF2971 domain-containing protein n=1 Tax=Leptospira wolffii TaxID=409998 RepID=UPI0003539791|nr:DUF2971 domain-containing protein [Leptospira wolffii]EPG68276.1 PF11185 family protein [Leptospira wolffii serovar Khorat str. Khorat-H2]
MRAIIFQKLKTTSGQNEIRKILETYPNTLAKGIFIDLALHFEGIFFAQSWSMNGESEAMWNSYSSNNQAIRIAVSEYKIREIKSVNLLYVDYQSEINLNAELNKIGISKNRTDFEKIYTLKRMPFSYEQEVRLIFKKSEVINEGSPAEIKLFKSALAGTEHEHLLKSFSPDWHKVDISYIESFIENVQTHPKSDDTFNRKIKEYCDSNNLKFIGKYDLYEPIV